MIYEETLAQAAITVAWLKAHARIDHDLEDSLLESYILAASTEAEHRMQREIIHRNDPYALETVYGSVPPAVMQYVAARAAQMYENRTHDAEGPYTDFSARLLDPYVIYDRDAGEASESDGSDGESGS